MDSNDREIIVTRESKDYPSASTPISDLGPSPTRTIRDFDKEFQDLKRENFNLKLRIYFLEEQNPSPGNLHEYGDQTSFVQQLQTEIEQLRRRLESQVVSADGSAEIYNFDYDDERRALRDELEKYRRENEFLRQSYPLNSNKSYVEGREKLATTATTTTTPSSPPPAVGQSIQTTTTTASVDSGLDTSMPGMSSTFRSNTALQFELNEFKERERKLQEQVNSLRRQIESSLPQTDEARAELDRARRQIHQYEVDIKNYEQQQSKAERVLQRLQTDYEGRIAHLVEQQQGQLNDFETYQHEPLLARIRFSYPLKDHASPTVNVEEYRQAIDDRDRIIERLEEAINEVTVRLHKPFTLILPSSTSEPRYTDERSQNLIRELNIQMQTHLETVDQLRAECVELRRGEKHLRNQVDSLTQLINTPNRNQGLPPLPRPSPLTSKIGDAPEDTQQIQDLQTAVVQITLQLQSDAENVSGLTNRVAQIMRDRDEWQDKINRLQDELEKKNAHIRQLERREPEVESRIRQQFALQIEILQRDMKELQEQVRDRDRRLQEVDNEKESVRLQLRKDYEKIDFSHNQEKHNLQGQLRTVTEQLSYLEKQLTDEHEKNDDLRRKYEQATVSTENQAEQLKRVIQQQKIQIEEFNLQIREIDANFQQERRRLEQEKNSEKDKNAELQNALNISKRQYTDLKLESDRLQSIFNEQRDKFEQQARIHLSQIAQFDRERDDSHGEVQHLRRENQTIKDRSWEMENRLTELARQNDEFKTEISTFKVRFQDDEDINQRYRTEIAQLQRDIQEISRQNTNHIDTVHEWERKYETIRNQLENARFEKDRIDSENRTIQNENTKLQQDIENITVQIRLEIHREYEEEYHQMNARRDIEVQNILKDKDATRSDLERLNSEKTRLIDRLQIVENNLKQADDSINHYETDITRLRQALDKSEQKTHRLEEEISRAYTDELKMKNDRLQDLDNKYRSAEIQLNQYEKSLHDLHQENDRLVELNERLRHEYDQYRMEQQNNYDALRRTVDNTAQKNSTTYEERVRREVVQATENKQVLIDQLENQLHEKESLIQELQNGRFTPSHQSNDVQVDLEIRIEQLEQEVEVKERFIQTHSETVQEKDQQIEKLLVDIQKGDYNNSSALHTLREELQLRDRRLDQTLNEKDIALNDRERHISELQVTVRDRESELVHINDKLRQLKDKFDIQQREFDDCRQKRDISSVIDIEENKANLEKIKFLEKQLQMTQNRNTTSEQIAHFQNIIEDLKAKLRQREDSIQSLQRTIADSDRELNETRRHVQNDSNRVQVRYEQMEKQSKVDLDDREQMIASLRKKLADKDQEINKLRDDYNAKEAKTNQLQTKSRESDLDSRSEYSAARAPANVSLRLEIQRKDDLIDDLKRQLDRARRDTSQSGRDDSSTVQYAQFAEVRRRPLSKTYDHLNREELLYELDMALQDNEGLLQQLAKRSPNITELHNQLLDVRKELARQKYVNQVLWRKLDALMDIQGSNTRTELAIELANYHDELEALKAKQHRTNDARLAIINASSRSSSETSLNKKDSGVESVMESARHTLTQQEYQRQINEKDDQIKQLTKQLNDLRKLHETEINQYRMKSEKTHTDLIDDLNGKQDDLRQARLQIDLLKSTRTQLEQAQDQNQRLHGEIKLLQQEIDDKKGLISHYEKQMSLLEKQISSRDGGKGEMSIRTSEMSELLEEMRRLRHDLERSISKQNELQAKLDENIRQSRTPREFTFSGRGVSYPDLRVIDASGLIAGENASFTSVTDEKRSRPLGSSTTELETEHINTGKTYVVGESENHENLRRLIADIKIELTAVEAKLKEKLRSKFTSALTDPSVEWLEHRLKSLTQCLARFEQAYQLIESYWKAHLPLKNNYDEHPFADPRLTNENKELKISQSKYLQDLQTLRQKYKEQSIYMDQVLAQLTKANHKKANTDDYLALLLRPTLDVLQKARLNMENHLKESNLNNSVSSGGVQSSRRRHRSNRLD